MPAPAGLFLFPAVEPLIGISKDGLVPTKLATSWDIAPDGKSLTLHLRQGVKFQDGTDFNAAAVQYDLNQELGVRPELNSVTSVDVVDNYTVRLNLSSYSNTLLWQLGWVAGLMESPTALQTHDKSWFSKNMVGTGPFEFVSFDGSTSEVFKKFNGYWDTGKPYLDGLQYTFVVDPMTAQALFLSGGAQLWDQVLPSSLKNIAGKGYQFNTVPRTVWMAIGDSAHPSSPYAQLQVRQALDYAIDKKTIVDTFGFNTWVAPIEPCAPNQIGYIPNFQGRTYDTNKAKQLLASAGYPNGFSTDLYARNNVDSNVLTAFQANLSAVGINAQIHPVDPGTYTGMQSKGWNGILLSNLGIVGSCAKMLQTDGPNSSFDVSANLSSQYTSALAQAIAAQDKNTEIQLNQQLVQLVYNEAIMLPWLMDSVNCVYGSSVHVDLDTISLQFWNPGNAWLSK